MSTSTRSTSPLFVLATAPLACLLALSGCEKDSASATANPDDVSVEARGEGVDAEANNIDGAEARASEEDASAAAVSDDEGDAAEASVVDENDDVE